MLGPITMSSNVVAVSRELADDGHIHRGRRGSYWGRQGQIMYIRSLVCVNSTVLRIHLRVRVHIITAAMATALPLRSRVFRLSVCVAELFMIRMGAFLATLVLRIAGVVVTLLGLQMKRERVCVRLLVISITML